MKRHIIILLLVAITTVASGQDIKYARFVIDTLASPYMHGRGYTFDGDKKAAKFIVSQLKKMHIKKFGKSYLQPFTIKTNVFPDTMEVKINKKELTPGIDYIIDARSNSCYGTFEVVTLTKHDLEVRMKSMSMTGGKTYPGKFIYLPKELSTDKDVKSEYEKILKDNPTRARGIITTSEKLVFVPSMEQKNFVHIIVTDSTIPTQIKEISVKIHAEYKTYQTQNIIGYLKGQTDTFIVLTAHYDHLGTMGDKTFFPGAHDNASGVAMVLNLAKHFSDRKCRPHYGLVFMFFSGEELGLVGSYYYTENPLFPLDKIKFLINFDLMGSGDEGIQIVNSKVFTKQYDLMKKINDEKHYLPQIKLRGPAANSDHYFFYEKGVPSFFIYSLGKYKQYHNVFDSRENIPLAGYNQMYKLFYDFIDALQ